LVSIWNKLNINLYTALKNKKKKNIKRKWNLNEE